VFTFLFVSKFQRGNKTVVTCYHNLKELDVIIMQSIQKLYRSW